MKTTKFNEEVLFASDSIVKIDASDISEYLGEVDSSYGKIFFTKPVAQLSETPGFWALPPSPFGSYEPMWH